jgi:uncharacterized protein
VPSIVSNTGPILALVQIGQLDLLRHLFGNIRIPAAVQAEVKDETSVAAIAAARWITVQAVQDRLAVQLLREELDAGESEAIILAKEISAELVLIDERAATHKARTVGLTVIGTLGLLLLGKQDGHLAAIEPLLEKLRSLGFYMSIDLYAEVLRTAGEAE